MDPDDSLNNSSELVRIHIPLNLKKGESVHRLAVKRLRDLEFGYSGSAVAAAGPLTQARYEGLAAFYKSQARLWDRTAVRGN